MWEFTITNGTLSTNRRPIAVGYSGHGADKNNPAAQNVPDCGPIPPGQYQIGPAQTNPTLGPFAMPLTPDPTNDMHGRSGFWIHGDNARHPGNSSAGCIVLQRPARMMLATSPDRSLTVIP